MIPDENFPEYGICIAAYLVLSNVISLYSEGDNYTLCNHQGNHVNI